MTISRIQATGIKYHEASTVGPVTLDTTALANFTAGNWIAIEVVHFGNPATDTISTFTINGVTLSAASHRRVQKIQSPNTVNQAEIWFYQIPSGAAAKTVTVTYAGLATTGGGHFTTYAITEWNFPLGASIVTTDTGNGNSLSPSVANSSGSPAVNDLVLAVFVIADSTNTTITQPSATPAWTVEFSEPNPVTHEAGSGISRLVTTAGTQTVTWTMANSQNWGAAMVVIRDSAQTFPLKLGHSPADLALPSGFVAMPNFGAGLRLGTPAVQLFQARKFAAPASTATIPLLQRRFREEVVTNERQARVFAIPIATTPDTAPLWIPRQREIVGEDNKPRRTRGPQPPIRLVWARRRIGDELTVDESASRARSAPQPPLAASLATVPRRLFEESASDEFSARSRVLPSPETADAAPLKNRANREAPAAVVDETTQRQRALIQQNAPVTNAPLQRKSVQDDQPEELVARSHAVPIPLQADASPLQNRKAVEQTVPDERATHVVPIPPAPTADFAPLPGRRSNEQATPDETANRFRQQPAASSDTAPQLGRRAIEQTVPDEVATHARNIPPTPSADFAPLRVRPSVDQIGAEEFQRRAPLVPAAPLVAAIPSLPRRILEWLGVEEWLGPRRAAPLALQADVAPLRARGAAQDLVANDEATSRAKLVQQSPAQAGAPVTVRRTTEETQASESAPRGRAVPLPVNADSPPTRNRVGTEATVPDEATQRIRPLPAASVDFSPLPTRRAGEQIVPDETAARYRQQSAPSIDFAPLPARRRNEERVTDEAAKHFYQPAQTPLASAPLTVARNREDVAPQEAVRRPVPAYPAPVVNFAPLQGRRAVEDTFFEDVWRRIKTFLGISSPPPAFAPAPIYRTSAVADCSTTTRVATAADVTTAGRIAAVADVSIGPRIALISDTTAGRVSAVADATSAARASSTTRLDS